MNEKSEKIKSKIKKRSEFTSIAEFKEQSVEVRMWALLTNAQLLNNLQTIINLHPKISEHEVWRYLDPTEILYPEITKKCIRALVDQVTFNAQVIQTIQSSEPRGQPLGQKLYEAIGHPSNESEAQVAEFYPDQHLAITFFLGGREFSQRSGQLCHGQYIPNEPINIATPGKPKKLRNVPVIYVKKYASQAQPNAPRERNILEHEGRHAFTHIIHLAIPSWCSLWGHDKNSEAFFDSKSQYVNFRTEEWRSKDTSLNKSSKAEMLLQRLRSFFSKQPEKPAMPIATNNHEFEQLLFRTLSVAKEEIMASLFYTGSFLEHLDYLKKPHNKYLQKLLFNVFIHTYSEKLCNKLQNDWIAEVAAQTNSLAKIWKFLKQNHEFGWQSRTSRLWGVLLQWPFETWETNLRHSGFLEEMELYNSMFQVGNSTVFSLLKNGRIEAICTNTEKEMLWDILNTTSNHLLGNPNTLHITFLKSLGNVLENDYFSVLMNKIKKNVK